MNIWILFSIFAYAIGAMYLAALFDDDQALTPMWVLGIILWPVVMPIVTAVLFIKNKIKK